MKILYGWAFLVAGAVVFASASSLRAELTPEIVPVAPAGAAFRFISWGDGQHEPANMKATADQASTLGPAFTIFNGDLEQDGVTSAEMNSMTTAMGPLYAKSFLVRGNHDDHVSGSSTLWENYFTAAGRPLPPGVTNYTALNSSSNYLTYSFDYGNSRFIGMDDPGDADLLTSAELTFANSRLADAEAKGLAHAFLFFHGPEYCIANHCSCSAAADGSCTPASLVNLLNKHPIVSATFHGHEHFLAWVHMDHTRVSGLTRAYEEFFTSPAGGYTTESDLHPARVSYHYPASSSGQGFAAIDVGGNSFTIRMYKTGMAAPVYSRTFTTAGGSTNAAFRSVGAYDGQVIESTESSGTGGAANATATTFRVGDDASNRQVRSILSFNTAGLPDNAVIKSVTLKIKGAGLSPANPYGTLGNLLVDIRTGAFGGNPALQAADFQVAPSRGAVMSIPNTPVSEWYSKALNSAYFAYINKTGITQFRLRFSIDDNNNHVADYIAFYSGDWSTPADRPILLITYSLP
ncbi:MAG TPA: metallophosphoesterase [Anaerolineales bacterium]|nr:metallophosphoesterase [Anaerolineales bacterium]